MRGRKGNVIFELNKRCFKGQFPQGFVLNGGFSEKTPHLKGVRKVKISGKVVRKK